MDDDTIYKIISAMDSQFVRIQRSALDVFENECSGSDIITVWQSDGM